MLAFHVALHHAHTVQRFKELRSMADINDKCSLTGQDYEVCPCSLCEESRVTIARVYKKFLAYYERPYEGLERRRLIRPESLEELRLLSKTKQFASDMRRRD